VKSNQITHCHTRSVLRASADCWIWCGGVLVVECLVGALLMRLQPDSWKKRMISGSPLLSWVVALTHQAVVFPSLTLAAIWPVIVGTTSLQALLHTTWADAPFGAAAFHAALVGHWGKDCVLYDMPLLVWVHHAVCLVAVSASMSGVLVRCASVFTLGAFTLEIGSGANSVCELFPSCTMRLWMTTLMTLSNLLAVGIVCWCAASFSEHGGIVGRWVAAFAGTALCAIRQQEWQKGF
jgi:hypothetical protein